MHNIRLLAFRAIQPLLFLRWIVSGKHAPPPHCVKAAHIARVQKLLRYSTLVETGTYNGDMIEAQKRRFRTIYSIELGDSLAELSRERFCNYSNIHIFAGDSVRVLPKILQKLREPAIFWLDAHYSGGTTEKSNFNTPIISELQEIFDSSSMTHAILIDDARLFTGKHDYPTVAAVKRLVQKYHTCARVYIEDDVIHIFC